jgi:putative ABC transport system substrate-binding protein
MRRREFIGAGVMASLWPFQSGAQQPPRPVIGVLGLVSPEIKQVQLNLTAFREGLGTAGYIEGQNVTIEYRWAERRVERLPALAGDLVARKVDVIVTEGGDATTLAAKSATTAIPIVFHGGSDPVALGWVASFDRPGGNLTGVKMSGAELIPKLLDLLLALSPQAKIVGVLRDPGFPLDPEQVASTKGVRLEILPVRTDSEVDGAFGTLLERQIQGLVVYSLNRARIAALASRHAIPALALYRDFPETGGLLSYGPSQTAAYRVKGIYTGRILNGEKPGDLPIERNSKLEMVVNLKTAKALGITVPQSIREHADTIIE